MTRPRYIRAMWSAASIVCRCLVSIRQVLLRQRMCVASFTACRDSVRHILFTMWRNNHHNKRNEITSATGLKPLNFSFSQRGRCGSKCYTIIHYKSIQYLFICWKTPSQDCNLKFIINNDVKRKKSHVYFFQIDNNFPWYIYSSTDHRNEIKMFKNQVAPRITSEEFPWTFCRHFYNLSECRPWKIIVYLIFIITLRACLHGGGGPQVSEVAPFGGVTRLSI